MIEHAAAAPATTIPAPRPAVPVGRRERVRFLPIALHPDVLGILSVLAMTVLLAWHRLWLENGLAYLDIPTFYLPWYAHLGESIRSFDIPGWNPYQFSGTAFAADPQSGWWYFPAMIFFTLFEPVVAYQLYLLAHLALAGVTTYLLCRQLGLRPFASLVGGAAYQSGPFVWHISCCLIHVQLGAWVPTALIGIELTVRGRQWSARLLGWIVGGFAISQMLAGWAGQGSYNALLLLAGYLVVRALTSAAGFATWRNRLVRLVIDGAGLFATGLVMGAAGLIPRLDYISRTNVAGGEYANADNGRNVDGWAIQILFSRVFDDTGNHYRYYLGAPILVLMLTAVVLVRTSWVRYFAVATAVACALTLSRTPLHELFYLLPRFEELHTHIPSRVLAVQWIGPPLLAAAAVDALLRQPRARTILWGIALAIAVWILIVSSLVAIGRPVSRDTTIAVLATCLLLALFALVARSSSAATDGLARHARWTLAGLLLMAILVEPNGRALIDTLRSGSTINPVVLSKTGPVSRDAIAENAATSDPGGAGEFLQAQLAGGEWFRFIGYEPALQARNRTGAPKTYREHYANPLAIALLVNTRAMRLGLYDAQGYNPVQLTDYSEYFKRANQRSQDYHDAQILPGGISSPLLNVLNVRYIVIPNHPGPAMVPPQTVPGISNYPEVFRNDTIRVLENPNVLPRAWIVHNIARVGYHRMPELLRSGAVDPQNSVLLDQDVPNVPGDIPTAAEEATESVEILTYEPDFIRLKVRMGEDGAVVLSETYDVGWTATVNGAAAPIYRAYGVIRAVGLRPGESIVELRYDPTVLKSSVYLSTAAILVALGVAAVCLRRRWLFQVRRDA